MPLKIVADVFDFAHRQFDFAHHQVDRVAPPQFRQHVWNRAKALYAEQPLRFTFILFQAAFALMPVLCCLTFSLSIFFAFAAGIFFLSLFWAGMAFCILVPVLIVSFFLALFAWGAMTVVVGLSHLASAGFKSAFTITERDFNPRHPVDYPALPGPAPPPFVNPGGPVSHKAKRPSTAKKENKPSDSEKEPVPHSDAGSGIDAPER